jgi:DNA-binding LytR/AlgR family response regulator
MRKINCVIADDEQHARVVLEGYLAKVEGLNLVAACANGTEVFNVLQQHQVDLLFLDLKMPSLSGTELLKSVPNLPPVILTTANSSFAIESYQFNVVDYLLKPISFDRFLRAVHKYNSQFPGSIPMQPPPADEPVLQHPFIYVRSEKKMLKVFFADILLIEGLKDYVQIQLLNKTVITHQTLSSFEEKLPANLFIRVHRSFIVSLFHISAFTARAIEVGKREVPIGESYSRAVLARLEEQG